jgi:lipoprotein-anchoring transpeptidase ErfK/SrfK
MPASLESLWTQGTDNVITRGAIMTFQDQNGLGTDGVAGPQVWQKLLQNVAAGTVNTVAYNYVSVSQAVPETTTVYTNGAVAYTTPANTGVAAAPTAQGTFPVYLRYLTTTMSGTNPDGSHYSDPGIPWVSYFNGGDALHGFDRSSYGTPQSDGCVEMPPANAAVVYPLTPIGTLVTVN